LRLYKKNMIFHRYIVQLTSWHCLSNTLPWTNSLFRKLGHIQYCSSLLHWRTAYGEVVCCWIQEV